MTTGTIKKVVADRGFGFITAEDAKEYFFHRGGLDSSLDFDRLVGGERVEFEIEQSPKGPRASARALRLDRSSRPVLPDGPPPPLARRRPRAPRGAAAARTLATPRRCRRPGRSDAIVRTAFVSTYPPRRCGIATFTQDLVGATGEREIVALHPPGTNLLYPAEVHHRIRRDEPGDYARTARALARCADVVSIQHEYGIWGGDDGAYVLDFVRALDAPAVATLHTVLRHADPAPARDPPGADRGPPPRPWSCRGRRRTLLTGTYGVDPSARRRHPPRRAEPAARRLPRPVKPDLDLAGREVILSFGLLGPGKGYELAIDALPAVVAARPTACYVVLGRHPPEPAGGRGRGLPAVARGPRGAARDGRARAVRRPVRGPGRAHALARGRRRLRDAVPEPRPDRLRHAVLRDGRRPGDRLHARTPTPPSCSTAAAACWCRPARRPRAADALIGLLENDELRARDGPPGLRAQPGDDLVERGGRVPPLFSPGRRAARPGPRVRTAAASRPRVAEPAPLHPVSRAHLEAISDAIGIMQHAIGARPDPGPRLLHRRRRAGPARRPRCTSASWAGRPWRRAPVAHLRVPCRGASTRRRAGSATSAPSTGLARRRGIGGLPGPGAAWRSARRSRWRRTRAGRGRRPLLERALPAARGAGRAPGARVGAARVRRRRCAVACTGETQPTLRLAGHATRRRVHGRAGIPSWPWPEPILTYENALPAAGADRRRAPPGRPDAWCDTGLARPRLAGRGPDRAGRPPLAGRQRLVATGRRPRRSSTSSRSRRPPSCSPPTPRSRRPAQPRYRGAMERAYAWFLGDNDRGARRGGRPAAAPASTA